MSDTCNCGYGEAGVYIHAPDCPVMRPEYPRGKPTTPASGGAQEPADDARGNTLLARIQGAVHQHREAPFRSADWLAGELMTIIDTVPANDEVSVRSPTEMVEGPFCVYSEPDVGLPPSLFEGRVGERGFAPVNLDDSRMLYRIAEALNSTLKRSPAESGDGFRDGLKKAAGIATQISDREAGLANDMPAGGDWQKHQHASNVALDIACLIRVETLAGTTTPSAESGGAQATAVGEAISCMEALMAEWPADHMPSRDTLVRFSNLRNAADASRDQVRREAPPLSRQDIYRFFDTLKLSEKRDLALRLGFDPAYVAGESDFDRWKRLFAWAKDNGKSDELASAIRLAASPHGGGR